MADESSAAAAAATLDLTAIKRPYKLLYSDLPADQSLTSVAYADLNLNVFTTEKDCATYLKKQFDAKYGGTWQCLVGTCFGCSLTHKTKAVVHFQIEGNGTILYVLLFQSEE